MSNYKNHVKKGIDKLRGEISIHVAKAIASKSQKNKIELKAPNIYEKQQQK